MVIDAIDSPDSDVDGHGGRRIAQKKLGRYVLRVIYEMTRGNKIVVTVYKAKQERYEI